MKDKKISWKRVLALLLCVIVLTLTFSYIVFSNPDVSFTTEIEEGSMATTASYVIFRDGSTYYARNGLTGSVISSTNASYIFQYASDNGYHIFVKMGNYSLTHTVVIDQPRHIEGEFRQWTGNEDWGFDPPDVGVNLFYSGEDPPNQHWGVFNVSAVNDVLIENIAIQGNRGDVPNMCGIQLWNATHQPYLRNVEISFFTIGIGTYGSGSTVDAIFDNVKIEFCPNGVQIGGLGYLFKNCFWYNNTYDVTINVATVHADFYHCWFAHTELWQIRHYLGNETQISFTECWFENNYGGIYLAENPVNVLLLKFDRCHFHTFKTSGYALDFSNIADGVVIIKDSVFDGTNSSVTTIDLPTGEAGTVIENCQYLTLMGGDIIPYRGTRKTGVVEASNDDWIDHGLITTPTFVLLTVQESDARYIAQVKASNATHFQLYLYDETAGASETVDKTIGWMANYE